MNTHKNTTYKPITLHHCSITIFTNTSLISACMHFDFDFKFSAHPDKPPRPIRHILLSDYNFFDSLLTVGALSGSMIRTFIFPILVGSYCR